VVRLGMSGSLQGDVRFRVGYVMGPVLVHGAFGYGMTRLAFSGSDGISSAWSRLTIPFWLASIGVDVPVTDHLFMRAALESSIGRADLPLVCHPAAIRASAGFTPCGAVGATGDRRSWSGLRSRSPVAVKLAA
jgi:hypothetical protein